MSVRGPWRRRRRRTLRVWCGIERGKGWGWEPV